MRPRSVTAARLFGLILIVLVSAWDMDAMPPHIAAHSWATLAFVTLFLIVHVSDYLTVGQLVNRIGPLVLTHSDGMTPSIAMQKNETLDLPEAFSHNQAPRFGWRKLFPLRQQQPSLLPAQSTPKLYTFTAVTTTVAQASGSPYGITQQHFIVEPE